MDKKLSKERSKPTVVDIGNGKAVIKGGRWNDDLMADHVLAHGQAKWINVGALAAFGFGGNTIPNKEKVRNRLSSLFKTLLRRRQFLAVEYSGKYRAATAVKIADLAIVDEQQKVMRKLKRMEKSKELTQDQFQQALMLFDALKPQKEKDDGRGDQSASERDLIRG